MITTGSRSNQTDATPMVGQPTTDPPRVDTRLRLADRLGSWRVRWGLGRMRYRVAPGLYRIGEPGADSPVLVTASYKLTFDVLRAELAGIDAWLLVLDTQGVNVWCAAGKGTFGTEELVRQVEATRLSSVVTHRRLIVPQLGASGVSAHEVRRRSGFKVVYGPVRARDIPAFLAAGMRATGPMRRVTFGMRERLPLIGVEIAGTLRWMLLVVAVLFLVADAETPGGRLATALYLGAPLLAGFLAATVLVPLLLPWIPGRAFALKGALVGAAVAGATLALLPGDRSALGSVQALLLATAIASFFAMQFTGATTFTSPSGVEWEMRRALPLQLGAVALAIILLGVRPLIG